MGDSYVLILISGSLLVTLLFFYITIFVVIQKNKSKRYLMEKKEMELRFENELLVTRLEVHESGLKLLSLEIHDNVGQLLTSVQADLMTLANINNAPENVDLINHSKHHLSMALKGLRNVSHVLNGEYVSKIGLEESLTKEVEYMNTFSNMQIEIDADGDTDYLPTEMEIMVFRIAQEALTNILKHARASRVVIKLRYSPERFIMNITDDGTGFGIQGTEKAGIGLVNMRQRAEIMKGTLTIDSENKKGTNIQLSIPL